MADVKTIFQTLVNNLSNLNVQLRMMAESLKKVESNEMEALKDSYDFKYSIINEIKSLANEFTNIQSSISNIMNRTDINHESIDRQFREIQDSLKNLPSMEKGDDSETIKAKDALIKEKDKWNKRLMWTVVILAIIVLTLLGLNAAHIINLIGDAVVHGRG